jgi:hypothetical protein
VYLFACRIKIKRIDFFFFTFNHRILYITILVVCRKNLKQSDSIDCKIIKIEVKEIVFCGMPRLLSML